jgi:hypothetical protein
MNPDFLRQVVIDGQATLVPSSSQIVDVVARDVTGITTLDTRTGRSHLIPRADFNGAVPAGFTTHLTPMGKG